MFRNLAGLNHRSKEDEQLLVLTWKWVKPSNELVPRYLAGHFRVRVMGFYFRCGLRLTLTRDPLLYLTLLTWKLYPLPGEYE